MGVTRALLETTKTAVNRLTVHDSGSTHVLDRVQLTQTRPQVVRRRAALQSGDLPLNIVAGDNAFELESARFLDAAPEVQAIEATSFATEYQAAGGGIIREYRLDFVVGAKDGPI